MVNIKSIGVSESYIQRKHSVVIRQLNIIIKVIYQQYKYMAAVRASATRPLEVREVDKIHQELHYVHDFINRYDSLFNVDRFKLSSGLGQEYILMCRHLQTMDEHSVAEAMKYCNKLQMQLLTIEDVVLYIHDIVIFSNDRMRELIQSPLYRGQYKHWDQDNQVLHIMERSIKTLFNNTSPIGSHIRVDPVGYMRLTNEEYVHAIAFNRQ